MPGQRKQSEVISIGYITPADKPLGVRHRSGQYEINASRLHESIANNDASRVSLAPSDDHSELRSPSTHSPLPLDQGVITLSLMLFLRAQYCRSSQVPQAEAADEPEQRAD